MKNVGNNNNLVTIRVWGDFACFTRPEMKVERVSYPLPTPSAARGILEAIYWEPQMYYVIDSIRVVKKGYWFSFRRNEISAVISIANAQSWMKGTKDISYIEAGGGAKDAAQRNMLALADVEYLITAEVRPSGLHDASRCNIAKYLREIKERVQKGKCFHRPAFGCREFAVDFDYVDDAEAVHRQRIQEVHGDSANPSHLWPDEDLGLILYDVFDHDERARGFRWLNDAELSSANEARECEIVTLPNSKQRKARNSLAPFNRYEGHEIVPRAYFFKARVKDACMDCHPDRVKLICPRPKED